MILMISMYMILSPVRAYEEENHLHDCTLVLGILLLDLHLCFMNYDCVLYGENVLLMLQNIQTSIEGR